MKWNGRVSSISLVCSSLMDEVFFALCIIVDIWPRTILRKAEIHVQLQIDGDRLNDLIDPRRFQTLWWYCLAVHVWYEVAVNIAPRSDPY